MVVVAPCCSYKSENIVEPVNGESALIMESLPDSVETESKITFELNEKFDNFTSLEKKIEQYERENFVVLYHRDARTLEKAVSQKKIAADRGGKNPSLKYYELKLTCNHGGKNHKPLGKGKRATNTFKQQCPFKISVRLSKNKPGEAKKNINLWLPEKRNSFFRCVLEFRSLLASFGQDLK